MQALHRQAEQALKTKRTKAINAHGKRVCVHFYFSKADAARPLIYAVYLIFPRIYCKIIRLGIFADLRLGEDS